MTTISNGDIRLFPFNLLNYDIRLNYLQNRDFFISWKVAGLILDEVIKFLNLSNPSSCTMDLGSTQPLTEMSTRNLPGG
jgi:hypothetical protein